MMSNDICTTDTATLRRIADELRTDARQLFDAGHREEAMRLFELFKRVTRELWRREYRREIASRN